MNRLHIVGGGLAGLSAALDAAWRGAPATLYEAAPHAGGRCRSFHDQRLDRTIDNGAHVLLGASRAALDYLRLSGGLGAMVELAPAAFPFLDLSTGARWAIRPNRGRLPWWIFAPGRRAPRTSALDHLRLWRLFAPAADAAIGDYTQASPRLARMLVEPLAVAVMNMAPDRAAAAPFARVMRETFTRGEAACRAYLPRTSLSAAFVDPALARIASLGGAFNAGWRLTSIETDGARATALVFDNDRVTLGPDDAVVLAVPAHIAAELLPDAVPALGASAIVNAHFRLTRPAKLAGGGRMLGLLSGLAQWLIVRDDVVSVTVSAADALIDRTADALLADLWRDVAQALDLAPTPVPPARLVKERRATFAQTPAHEKLRPGPRTRLDNLVLAGDWTATGLPATIEGAVLSGQRATQALLNT